VVRWPGRTAVIDKQRAEAKRWDVDDVIRAARMYKRFRSSTEASEQLRD